MIIYHYYIKVYHFTKQIWSRHRPISHNIIQIAIKLLTMANNNISFLANVIIIERMGDLLVTDTVGTIWPNTAHTRYTHSVGLCILLCRAAEVIRRLLIGYIMFFPQEGIVFPHATPRMTGHRLGLVKQTWNEIKVMTEFLFYFI